MHHAQTDITSRDWLSKRKTVKIYKLSISRINCV